MSIFGILSAVWISSPSGAQQARAAHANEVGAMRTDLPASTLAVRDSGDRWHTFWSAATAPAVWHDALLARTIPWRTGIASEWGELALAGTGEAWRTRLIVVRMRPERVRFRLDTSFTTGREPNWSIDRAPPHAAIAINAGQFEATMPWGWVVLDGRQWLSPQQGPLSAALLQDASGQLRWVPAAEIAAVAATPQKVRWAFQSYPVLLAHDTVPTPLRGRGRGIDVAHRDARAAICLDRDGQLIIALTRFDAIGASLGFIPFGLTTPEMAGVMGALGCRDAMLLDGGISAQMAIRDRAGVRHRWIGVRRVPLGLIGFAE